MYVVIINFSLWCSNHQAFHSKNNITYCNKNRTLKKKSRFLPLKTVEINYFDFSDIFQTYNITHQMWTVVISIWKNIFNQLNYPCIFLPVIIFPSSSCEYWQETCFCSLFIILTTLASSTITWVYGDTTTATTVFKLFILF